MTSIASSSPRPHVFRHPQYGIFSSPTAEDMPIFPVPKLGRFYDPPDTLRTLWNNNQYIFWALVPLSPRLDVPPFDVIRSYNVVQHTHGGWGLAPESAQRWSCLEDNLINVAKICLLKRVVYFPMDSQYPRLPHTYGYSRTHKSEKGAKLALHNSRAAFFVLMAFISFLVVGAGATEAKRNAWLNEILIEEGLSYDDVKGICNSELVDFSSSYPRAGVIVNHTCQFLHYIHTFIRFKIPVWFHWGDGSSQISIESFNQYRPTRDEVVTADWREMHRGSSRLDRRRREPWLSIPDVPVVPVPDSRPSDVSVAGDHQPRWHCMPDIPVVPAADSRPLDGSSDYSTSRSPSPSCNIPPPEPGPHQLKGETWPEFFRRRENIRQDVIKHETLQERAKRIQVEEARANFAIPGRSGSHVYRWRRNKHGFWIRTSVSRNEVPERWAEYTNSQKRFDSILNQWDLCRGLDKAAEPIDDDEDDIYDEFMGNRSQSPVGLPSGSSSTIPEEGEFAEIPGPSPVSSSASLAPSFSTSWDSPPSWGNKASFEMLTLEEEEDDDPHTLDVLRSGYDLSLLAILSLRFGYVPPLSALSPILNQLEWSNLEKILGVTDSNTDGFLKHSITVFVSKMVTGQPVPAQLCDLLPDSPIPFADNADTSLRLIKNVATDGVPQYMLVPRRDTTPAKWQLGLEDPVTLLQCFRLNMGPSISNIVRYLFSNGIPFHTYIPASNLPHVYPKYPPIALSFRPISHKPRISEYPFYENTRHSLLSRSYGRAALLQGGIIWRLALDDFEHKEDAEYNALLGPSESVSVYSHILRTNDGQRFYDDGLNDTELDIICGVYKVATGNRDQTSDLSWWPKQSVFMRSGLWLGYWTPDCERWFQQRLDAIRKHKADLKTSSKWHSALRYYVRSSSKFVNANAAIANNFLGTAAADILS